MTASPRSRCRRGASAVEFALLMPVFVGIVFGLVEYSWLTFRTQEVAAAVQNGCRSSATIDPGLNERDMDLVLSAARSRMVTAYQHGGGTCADCVAAAVAVGTLPNRAVQCSLSVPFDALTGFLPTPARVRVGAVSRLEYQRRQQ